MRLLSGRGDPIAVFVVVGLAGCAWAVSPILTGLIGVLGAGWLGRGRLEHQDPTRLERGLRWRVPLASCLLGLIVVALTLGWLFGVLNPGPVPVYELNHSGAALLIELDGDVRVFDPERGGLLRSAKVDLVAYAWQLSDDGRRALFFDGIFPRRVALLGHSVVTWRLLGTKQGFGSGILAVMIGGGLVAQFAYFIAAISQA